MSMLEPSLMDLPQQSSVVVVEQSVIVAGLIVTELSIVTVQFVIVEQFAIVEQSDDIAEKHIIDFAIE
jgi:hypothetical protein